MNTDQQLSLFRSGQPDEEAIRLLRGYEDFALKFDPRGYCVCTSEGKDSRVLGHLMRRAGVKHFYIHNITGIDPPELVYFQRKNFQEYADAGYEVHDCMYDMSIWKLMDKKKIPPLRHMRYCCEHLKERKTPEQGDAMISTGVRAERLQDINLDPPGPDNQVIKEGLHYLCDFIAVWEMTIKPANRPLYGWDANPWVWVIEFEHCEKPEGWPG